MKNVVLFFTVLDLCGMTALTYKFCNKLYSLKDNKILEYEYVDFYGNKGVSKHCYKNNKDLICRNGKKGVSVVRYEEKRGE